MKLNLRDMKRKAEKYPMGDCCPVVSTEGKAHYPYGLRLNLGREEIEKLGLDVSGLSVGDEVAVIAKASVVAKSESTNEDEDEVRHYQDCSIQIEKLEITPEVKKTGTIKEILSKASDSL